MYQDGMEGLNEVSKSTSFSKFYFGFGYLKQTIPASL